MNEASKAISLIARMTGTTISPKAPKRRWQETQDETPIFAETIRAHLPGH